MPVKTMPTAPKSLQKTCRRIRFSDSTIARLKPPAKGERAYEYSDVVYTGLHLISSSSGKKSLIHRFYHKTKKICITLGEHPAISVEEARMMVLQNKNLLAKNIDPRAVIQRQITLPTLKEFFVAYFIPHIRERKRTWKEDDRKFYNYINPKLGNRPVKDISKSEITLFIQPIKSRTSGATANRYLALFSSIFNHAVELEFMDRNPVKGIKRFQESNGRERYLTDVEQEKFITALNNAPSRVAALALLLLLATGMRKSECLTLLWCNVDLSRKQLTLPMENTKGKRSRTVVLNSVAVKIVLELQTIQVRGNPYVFPGLKPGKHLVNLRKTFLTACKAAGLTGYRIHDLRHQFCSKLASAGVSLFIIARLVGHRTLRTTERYSHLNDKCLRDAAEIIGDNFTLDEGI